MFLIRSFTAISPNAFDVIVSIIGIIAIIQGLRKGLIRQAFGLLALFLGCYLAYFCSDYAGGWLDKWFDLSPRALSVLSFIITFIIVLAAVQLLGKLAENLIKVAQLSFLNRFLGMIFALVKWTFILVVVVYLLVALENLFGFHTKNFLDKSVVYPFLERLLNIVFPYLNRLGQ